MIRWVEQEGIKDEKVAAFYKLFVQHKSETLIANVNTEVKVLSVADTWFLVATINDTEWDNSYVCSPYTAFITYSREELDRNIKNNFIRKPIRGLLSLCSGWFKKQNINRVIHLNNFLFSTNPYSGWQGSNLPQITTFIRQKYPDHAIVFRSLNTPQHALLMEEFKLYGYQLSATRQVYLFHPHAQTYSMHRNIKLDKRKIRQRGLQWIGHERMGEYLEQALNLYNKLYLGKYSRLNPHYTLCFLEACHRQNILFFQGYIDEEDQLKAFSGMFEWGDTITSPLVGYDTDAPQKEELYLHASQLVFRRMFETGKMVNLSSGAALFKRLRGGQPHIEYSAIYDRHLPSGRRRLFRVLRFLTNHLGVPILRKYKL